MRIAATQTFPGPAWDELQDVTLLESWPPAEPLPGIEVLVEAVVAVGPEELDLLPDLRLVANYGVGYDRVDVAACRERGVAVTNTPGVLDAAVADLTLALILACRRHLVASDRFVREGRWRRGWARPELLGRDLEGSTLGLVGFGRIGRQVARRAQAFGMRIVFHRRTGGLPLDELLRTADVVSLHVPLTPETDGLISRERLALLQDGATLVNTARGAIVDEDALVEELVSGRISAGLDVFADEPRVPEPLLEPPECRADAARRERDGRDAGRDDAGARRQRARVPPRRALAGRGLGLALARASGGDPAAHLEPVARRERCREPLVRVPGVEDVPFEVAADRDLRERDVLHVHERVRRQLRLGDGVVLELKLRRDLHQLGPVWAGA